MEVLSKILRTSFGLLLLLSLTQLEAQEEKPQLISFTIKNAGVNVKGTFRTHEVSARFDPNDLDNAVFGASISVSSLDTGIKGRDKHLKKAKYFDLENHPYITFQSTGVSKTAEGYLLRGDLTIKKTTLPVEIPFTVTQSDGTTIFKGKFELNRRDYAVGKGHLIMGDKVKVSLYHEQKSY